MRKFTVFVLPAFLLMQCASLHSSRNIIPGKTEIKSDWYYYSNGLFYKSNKEYKKAIKYFMDAAAYKTNLDNIYYQMAECYYFLFDYESAVNYAEQSIKIDPQNSKPYVLIYNIYMNLQTFDKAAAALEALIKIKPNLVNIQYTLANLYFSQLKNMDKSMVYFNNILEIAKSDPVEEYYLEYSHYYLGHIYYSKNKVDKSLEHFKKCLEINPDNYYAIYILSLISMEQYYLDDAKKYSFMYLEKFPDNNKMNSVIGRIYYLRGDYRALQYLRASMYSQDAEGTLSRALYLEMIKKDDDAEKLLKDFVKNNSVLISPHIALARIYQRKGNRASAFSEYFTAGILMYRVQMYGGARENLLKAASLNETVPEVYFYLARLNEDDGNFSLAIMNYKKTYDIKPSVDLLIHIGYLYSQKNDFREATTYLDKAIELEPGNSKPYFFKGLVYSSRDDFPSAEKFIRKAISINEDNDTYHFYLATVLEKQKKLMESIEALKKSIQYNSRNARAYNYLGYLYADNNMNLDESIELIKKALEMEPSNGAYLDSLGWAYFRKKEYTLALKILLEAEQQLEKEKSPDPVVFDHIGDAYRETGDMQKALDYWKKSNSQKKDAVIQKKIREFQVRTH